MLTGEYFFAKKFGSSPIQKLLRFSEKNACYHANRCESESLNMSVGYAILVSIGICIIAAAFEGACAGKNVKSFFAELKFPRFAAPFWLWTIIGGVYYLVFWFVLYRLLRLENDSLPKMAALILIVFMMLVNGLTNYVIFRAKNLWLSFVIGALFPVMDIALLIFLAQLDTVAALSLIPYLIYRVYGVWWGYALWKVNAKER